MNLCMNTIGEYLYYGIFYKSNGGGCSGPIENIEIYSYTFLCTMPMIRQTLSRIFSTICRFFLAHAVYWKMVELGFRLGHFKPWNSILKARCYNQSADSQIIDMNGD